MLQIRDCFDSQHKNRQVSMKQVTSRPAGRVVAFRFVSPRRTRRSEGGAIFARGTRGVPPGRLDATVSNLNWVGEPIAGGRKMVCSPKGDWLQSGTFFHPWVTGEPPVPRHPHPAFRRPISQCIQYLTIASARCRLAPSAAHAAIAFEPAPSGYTASVLRRRSMGLLALVRTQFLLAAGAALRSSGCWPRSASYATPK